MRRDVLIGLEEAAQLDTLPMARCSPDETTSPEVAVRFAAVFAESERLLASTSETMLPSSATAKGAGAAE